MRRGIEGLIDPDTGELARRVPIGARPIFAVEVCNGELQYKWADLIRTVQNAGQERRLLENFLELATAPDQTIKDYARKSGVLGLCAHGLPAGHGNLRNRLAAIVSVQKELRKPVHTIFDRLLIERLRHDPAKIDAPCFPQRLTPATVFSEPLELWRSYATLMGELLKLAAHGRDRNRGELARTLDHWLELAPLRLCCSLGKRDRLALTLQPINQLSALFGVLGAQVFFAASGSKGLLVCSSCGHPYIPEQLPRTGTHTYCPKCGTKAAQRAASRRYYHKKKETADGAKTHPR